MAISKRENWTAHHSKYKYKIFAGIETKSSQNWANWIIANRWSAYINLYSTMCTQHHTICADYCGRCCRYGRSYGQIGPYTAYLAKWNKNSKQASHFLFTCFVLIRFRLSRFFFFTVRRYSLLFGFNRYSLAAFFSAFQLCVFFSYFYQSFTYKFAKYSYDRMINGHD